VPRTHSFTSLSRQSTSLRRAIRVDDYSTADFVDVGRFDTYPDDDSSDFAGAWSVYPYFKSGLLAVSSIEEGLFLVKRAESRRRLRGARV